MNDKSCTAMSELLVAYADGELSPADARRVADHLAGCPDCRAELQLLRRSLELAREVWQESAAAAVPRPSTRLGRGQPSSSVCHCFAEAVLAPIPTKNTASAKQWHTLIQRAVSRARPDRRRIYAAACVAACAAVLTAGPWLFSRWKARNEVAIPEKVQQPDDTTPVEAIDVEALIARECRAARLAAAVQLLASQPGLGRYRKEAERYLAEAYHGTAAVNGTLPPESSPGTEGPKS